MLQQSKTTKTLEKNQLLRYKYCNNSLSLTHLKQRSQEVLYRGKTAGGAPHRSSSFVTLLELGRATEYVIINQQRHKMHINLLYARHDHEKSSRLRIGDGRKTKVMKQTCRDNPRHTSFCNLLMMHQRIRQKSEH